METAPKQERPRKKRQRLLILIYVVLAAVLVVSLVMLARDLQDYAHGRSTYSEAEKIANIEAIDSAAASQSAASEAGGTDSDSGKTEAELYAEALQAVDLDALREVNGDVLGWIYIPDTPISYPIVKSGDNSYYLTRTWNLEYSSVGSIFLDELSSADFSDYNTIIYGHRMKDGSMFASLKYYKKQDYWQQHPYVYIVTDSGVQRYEIFAAYEAGTESKTYQLSFADDSAKTAFINHCVSKSVIDTGVVPTTDRDIITLSTCTGNGYATRWVVQAVAAE